MTEVSQISEFGKILIFLITGIIMVCGAFFVNRALAPKNPTPEKLTSYECGEEVTGNAWLPFNSRFYVIALIFLLFDVEMVFVFPWAIVFGSHEANGYDPRWGWLSLIEMFLFLGILILGLVYVWVKGDLEWIKPKPIVPITTSVIPQSVYDQLNQEQSNYRVKAFSVAVSPETVSTGGTIATAETPEPVETPAPVRKPMFKPTFKKPGNEQ